MAITATDGYIAGIIMGVVAFTLYIILVATGMPLRGLFVALILLGWVYWIIYKAEKGGVKNGEHGYYRGKG